MVVNEVTWLRGHDISQLWERSGKWFLQILADRHSWTSNSWYYLIDLKLLHAVPRWKIQSLHYITIICPIPDTQIQRFCCCANSEKPNKSFSVNFHWMWILTQLKLSHISSVVEWDIGIAFGPNNVFKYFSQNNFAAEILVFSLAVFDSLAKNVPLQCRIYTTLIKICNNLCITISGIVSNWCSASDDVNLMLLPLRGSCCQVLSFLRLSLSLRCRVKMRSCGFSFINHTLLHLCISNCIQLVMIQRRGVDLRPF